MSAKVFFEGAVVSAVCAVKAFQSKTKRIEQILSMTKNVRSGYLRWVHAYMRVYILGGGFIWSSFFVWKISHVLK